MDRWSERASSIGRGLLEADPSRADTPQGVNVLLSALQNARHLIAAPREFVQLADAIELDGTWGPVAEAAHMKLAGESGDNQLRVDVANYYAKS